MYNNRYKHFGHCRNISSVLHERKQNMFFKKIDRIISLILCLVLLSVPTVQTVFAATVEIDAGGLFDEDGDNTGDNSGEEGSETEEPGGDTDGSGNTGDSGNSGNSGNTGSSGNTHITTSGGNNNKEEENSGEEDNTQDEQTGETETDETEGEQEAVNVDFSDVKESDWFYSDVRELAGMKIIEGYPDGTFLPEGNVTRAEFLKMIVTLLCEDKFSTDDYMFTDVNPEEWYSSYIATAIVYGFIDLADYGETFEPDKAITRREVAKIIVNALQVEAEGYKTPYMDTADPKIIALYGLCIMQGSYDPVNGGRYFYPDTNITRAESAAVILRIHKLRLDPEGYVQSFKEANNVPELELLMAPDEPTEFYNEFTNAWENSQAFIMYTYPYGSGSEQMRIITEKCYEGYMLASEHHPELATHISVGTETKSSENNSSVFTLTFSSAEKSYTYEQLCQMYRGARKAATEIAPALAEGCENDLEIADNIHDFLAENTEYDFNLSPASYTAYGALIENKAVCQGYSGAFNLLCEAAGVKSLAVANKTHMWNVVLYDGELYHYDVTYDDPGSEIAEVYKGIPESEFSSDADHAGYRLPELELFEEDMIKIGVIA